jgi:hypothetical protein
MPIPKSALDKVPADRRSALDAAVAGLDDFIAELEAGHMRQDDYSRKMNEWQAEKKEMLSNHALAEKQYNEMFEDWQKGQASVAELTKAKQELDAAKAKITDLEKRAPAIDPARVISPEDVDEKLNNYAAGQIQFLGEAEEAAFEIQDYLGKRVSPTSLMKEALAAKKTPKAYAEEKFELPKHREAAETKRKEEHEKKIREDERTKTIAELSNPATRPLSDSKDAFVGIKQGDKNVQPWELTEVPADEQKLLQELTAASGR